MIKLGYDGKRAFFNNTGLGNYSRDTIRVVSKKFTNNKWIKNIKNFFDEKSNKLYGKSKRRIQNKQTG